MYITNFKQNEFSRKSFEPTLTGRTDTNLLNSMLSDEGHRASVCKIFMDSLKEKGKDIILSAFHLDWALECIAYAFSLPTLEFGVIRSAIKIYSNWLTVESLRPKVMEGRLEYYQREMIGHLSLVFYKKDDLVKQAELCNEVLKIMQRLIRYNDLEKKLWTAIIQIFILISDYMLINSPSLADNLSHKFLKLFFEVILKSKNDSELVWMSIKKCLKRWIKNENLINHWTSVNVGLTKSVISLLYLNNYDEIEIVFDHSLKSPDLLKVSITDSEKVFFWYKINGLLIDESYSKIANPSIQTALSHSVHTIIDNFLTLCEQRIKKINNKNFNNLKNNSSDKLSKLYNSIIDAHKNYSNGCSKLPIPSINSILQIYGKWLFTHVSADSLFEPLGKSEIISILCRIFSVSQGPAQMEYLSNFFQVLLENLNGDDQGIIGEILKSSSELISYGLETIKFLLYPNSFIRHVKIYLSDKDSDALIKSSCYTVLTIISPLCNKYQTKEFNQTIVDIYSQALGLEEDNSNFCLLIWSMFSFAVTVIDDQHSLHSIICIMIGRIESFDYKDKDKQKFFDMIDAISILPYMINKRLITSQVAKQNIYNLLAFLPNRTKSSDLEKTNNLIFVLLNWLDGFFEIFQDKDVKNEFFLKVLENSKYVDKEFFKFVKGFALNNLGKIQSGDSGLGLSCLFQQSVSNYRRRHFIMSSSIVSAYQKKEESGLVIRSPSGLYSWKFAQVNPKPQEKKHFDMAKLRSPLLSKEEKTSKFLSDVLFEDLNQSHKTLFKIFEKKFEYQKTSKMADKPRAKKDLQSKSNKPECSFHRSFLGQLGLLDGSSHITPLSSDHFERLLGSFDSIVEKEMICFLLLYLEVPEDTEAQILNHRSYSSVFVKFLQSLGTLVTRNKTKPSQVSNAANRYKKAIYKNTGLFESTVVLPEFCGKLKNKKFSDFIHNFKVIVLWNQKLVDRHSKKIPDILDSIDFNRHTLILINVINEKISGINVYGFGRKSGPLLNYMVVPNEVLATMVHFTVYNSLSSYKTRSNIWKHRHSVIKESKDDYSKNIKNSYYNINKFF